MSNNAKSLELYTTVGMAAWLCGHSDYHSTWEMGAFDQNIVPPLAQKQFKMYLDESGMPVGLVTWAWLSEQRCSEAVGGKGLEWEDWHSGEQLYCHDFLAPWGHGKHLFKDLKVNVFPHVKEVLAIRGRLNGSIRSRVHMKFKKVVH